MRISLEVCNKWEKFSHMYVNKNYVWKVKCSVTWNITKLLTLSFLCFNKDEERKKCIILLKLVFNIYWIKNALSLMSI